jgi:putative glycosyltransferase (TIGR04372 family)
MFNNIHAFLERLQFFIRYYFFYAIIFANIVTQEFHFRLLRFFPLTRAPTKAPRHKVIKFICFLPLIFFAIFRAALKKTVRILIRIKGVIRFVHKKISGRALNALVNQYPVREDLLSIFNEFRRQIFSGKSDPTLLAMAISLAIKFGEIAEARDFAERLLKHNPEAFNDHQQAGVWFFIGGYYTDAEKIWGMSSEVRELAINEEGLDQFNLRFLGPSWLLAIGHIAHIDTYLKHKILSGNSFKRTIILQPRLLKIPNQALLDCFRQHVEIFPVNVGSKFTYRDIEFLQDEFWSMRLKPNHIRMFSHAGAHVQQEWDDKGYGPLMTLPPDLEAQGWSGLERLGVPPDRWFVCLHVREAGFHKAWHEKHPGTRNAEVASYMKAVDRIIERGGYVIRVGDPTMKKVPPRQGLVDYAHSEIKSDEMDVFLCAKARFFIGTNSGLGLVPPIFGVPCALTNWTPIALPQWYGSDRFIPKVIWSTRLGRALTLTELFTSTAAWQQFQSYFDSSDLEVLDNTPEELEELIVELLDETEGKSTLTAEDENLVRGYNQLAVQHGSYVGARLGRDWLRRHAAELCGLSASSDASGKAAAIAAEIS